MKKALVVLLMALTGCDVTGPESKELVVRGTVVDAATGAGVAGARVRLSVLATMFSPGGPVAGAISSQSGAFEIRTSDPACIYYFLEVESDTHHEPDVRGFQNPPCPGVVSGVEIRMQPFDPVAIVTPALPDAYPTVVYREALQATGGDGWYEWTVSEGELPSGLELVPHGELVGIPGTAGVWEFVLRATSGNGQSAERGFSIAVEDALVLQPDQSCASFPDSAIATFEDPDLAHSVRVALGGDAKTVLRCGVVTGLTELDAGFEPGGVIRSLVGLQNLSALTWLNLQGNDGALNPLSELTRLEYLDLTNGVPWTGDAPGAHSISSLSDLTALRTLRIQYTGVADLTPLTGLTRLETLDLRGSGVSDLGPLAGLTALTWLDLSESLVESATPLGGLTNLRHLELEGAPITDVGTLAGLSALEHLNLAATGVQDVEGLEALTGLRFLNLQGLGTGLTDLTPLSNLTLLTHLNLAYREVVDIGPLANLADLVTLNLLDGSVVDVGPLGGLAQLDTIFLSGNRDLSDLQPLVDNAGIAAGDVVEVQATRAKCDDVAALKARGVRVFSDCG